MRVLRRVVTFIAVAGTLMALVRCSEPRYLTVGATGSYYEAAVLGHLGLSGTLTYCWPDSRDETALPYDVAFVADARNLDTGARYTLYGHSGDAILGMPLWFLAYDGSGQVAFEGLLTVEPPVPDADRRTAVIAPFDHGESGRVIAAPAP